MFRSREGIFLIILKCDLYIEFNLEESILAKLLVHIIELKIQDWKSLIYHVWGVQFFEEASEADEYSRKIGLILAHQYGIS